MEYKYNVLDVSRYIIETLKERSVHISNLKLQKLLYYTQGLYVTGTNMEVALFDEDFEAWDYGPAIPIVYREFKYNGSSSITDTSIMKYDYNDGHFSFISLPFNCNIIDADDQIFINKILDIYGTLSANQLVQLTHKEKPWLDVYQKGKNNIITKESLRDYFKKFLKD